MATQLNFSDCCNNTDFFLFPLLPEDYQEACKWGKVFSRLTESGFIPVWSTVIGVNRIALAILALIGSTLLLAGGYLGRICFYKNSSELIKKGKSVVTLSLTHYMMGVFELIPFGRIFLEMSEHINQNRLRRRNVIRCRDIIMENLRFLQELLRTRSTLDSNPTNQA